jgi:uncharacterized repeat protein (TIGR03803 family)
VTRPGAASPIGILAAIAGLTLCAPNNARADWNLTVIRTFGDGAGVPTGTLVWGPGGSLYGTRGTTIDNETGSLGGAVFELTPPVPPNSGPWSATVLHQFAQRSPGSGVMVEQETGRLYVTADGGYAAGVAINLIPHGTGADETWTSSLLHKFAVIEFEPYLVHMPGVVMDQSRNLFGVFPYGGPFHYGIAYRLMPGEAGWTKNTLFAFTGGTVGGVPSGPLLIGPNGSLYGVSLGGGIQTEGSFGYGTVYQLTPPGPGATTWTHQVIYNFANGADGQLPAGPLVSDGNGNLYGTSLIRDPSDPPTYGSVIAFELSPPAAGQTAWTETTLATIPETPLTSLVLPAGLIFDGAGNLYGATASGGDSSLGSIFRLSPPVAGHTEWTETQIYSFAGGMGGAYPNGGLLLDSVGNLYGTTTAGGKTSGGDPTSGFGIAFELSP